MQSYNEILRSMVHKILNDKPLTDFEAGSAIETLLMAQDEEYRMTRVIELLGKLGITQ